MRRITPFNGYLLAGLVVLILVFGCWYLFLDAPSITDSELDAEPLPVDPAASSAEYSITATIESRSLNDESDHVTWEIGSRYAARSAEYYTWRRTDEPSTNRSVAEYQQFENGTTVSYARFRSTDGERFADRLEAVRADASSGDGSLWVRNGTKTYVFREPTDGRDLALGSVAPHIGVLHVIPYEQAGTTTRDGATVERYVPTSGWVEALGSTDDEPDWYAFDTSGTVSVDADSGRIVEADVAFSTRRTDARAGKWFGDGDRRVRVSYSYEESVDEDAIRPAWATNERFGGSN